MRTERNADFADLGTRSHKKYIEIDQELVPLSHIYAVPVTEV
jgi:hypothetical protein